MTDRQRATLGRLGTDGQRRWAAARLWAVHQAPYLATGLLALELVVVDQSDREPANRFDLTAFPVDPAWHVYVDPDTLAAVDVPTVGFWLVHQVTHLLRHHAARGPHARPGGDTTPSPLSGRTPEDVIWSVAADAEINDDLVAGLVQAPESAARPSALGLPDGRTAEEYFDTLGGPGAPPVSGQAGACGHDDGGRADCGSGSDGRPRQWDCGRIGMTATGRRLVEADVARRIREHQQRRGDVPAGWTRWADDTLEPVVAWQRVLAAAIRRGVAEVAGRVDFTYRRPSRRSSAAPGIILPSLRQPLPVVAMVIDTSGSMSDSMLGQALAEVAGVLQSVGIGRRHLRVVCCDAQAYEAQRVVDPRAVRLAGGGGTDMGAGLAAAGGLRPRPDLIVVITDGHTPWPTRPPPRTKVLVGLMDRSGQVPDWAVAIPIEAASVATR
jgi:predicted metal-dependent peptidase